MKDNKGLIAILVIALSIVGLLALNENISKGVSSDEEVLSEYLSGDGSYLMSSDVMSVEKILSTNADEITISYIDTEGKDKSSRVNVSNSIFEEDKAFRELLEPIVNQSRILSTISVAINFLAVTASCIFVYALMGKKNDLE